MRANSNKDFYTIEEDAYDVDDRDRVTVGQTESVECEPICIYKDTDDDDTDGDQLCLFSEGSLNAGFTWEKDSEEFDYDDAEGYVSIDFI